MLFSVWNNLNVFINCPFDDEYWPILKAIVFTIHALGFVPRCALESYDASESRLKKILDIIAECRYGIHDLSRVEISDDSELPRFNMPFELGLYLGCRRFGGVFHYKKKCLILDRDPFRYQRFISDISGQDIKYYREGDIEEVIDGVRELLYDNRRKVPGRILIYNQYLQFEQNLPAIYTELGIDEQKIGFNDFSNIVKDWLKGTA